jgi:DNA-binding phage protein
MKPTLVPAFMKALRQAVDDQGLTAVATKAGLSKTTVSGWLNAGKVPSLEAAGLVAKVIGFDLGPHNK